MSKWNPTRREAIKAGLLAGAGLAVGRLPLVAETGRSYQLPLITKPIPSTGERLPVIGLGTNRYGVSTPEEMAPLRDVLRQMPGLGGKVIDTAPSYRASESVLGQLMSELGNRNEFFLATKVTAPEGNVQEGIRQMENSFEVLKTDVIDLMEVHNLRGTDAVLPVMKEWKQEGRIRYIGVTTSSTGAHEALMEIMRREPLDFIQVNYSIGSRDAAEAVLPLAEERGMAVLEAVRAGCRPLLPNRLSYPENFPDEFLYDDDAFLERIIESLDKGGLMADQSKEITEKFSWNTLANQYTTILLGSHPVAP